MMNIKNSEKHQLSLCEKHTNIERPVISFALFAYNQERYIEAAILGAFSQTYSPLEVILSDDCSPDGTFAIMERLAGEYRGPHKIVLNRNSANLGLTSHVNKVTLEIAKGEIIVMAAGDDISMPERTEKTWMILRGSSKIKSVSFAQTKISENGDPYVSDETSQMQSELQIYSLSDYIAMKDSLKARSIPMWGCSRAFRRVVMDSFGPLCDRCATEDPTLRLRAMLLGEIAYSAEAQVKYRIHASNLSANDNAVTWSQRYIYKQYLRDLLFAKRNGLISGGDATQLKNRLRLQVERDCVLYPFNQRKTAYTLLAALRSSALSFSEKKSLAKKCIPIGVRRFGRFLLNRNSFVEI